MEVDETGDKLRTYRSRADISATCSRLCEAFALIDDLDALVEIPAGTAASVGQRVTIVSGGSVGSRDGVVKSCVTPGFLNVILDDGLLVSDVSDRDVIGLIKEKDAHLDFVSRIVWSQALSEGRLPLSGAHLLPALCPWEMCERAFHLTEPWTEHLWTTPPALADIGFNSWLYLFAESIRMKAKASLVLALRIVEEAAKQLASAEDPSSSLRSAFLVGVGELVRYWPAAVTVLGVSEAGGPHGAFSILRHMLSTQAVKVLRALYRKPTQIDMGSEVILDKSLLKRRCAYYIEMQRAAEDELRDHFSSSPFSEVGRSGSLFGDGQAAWNAGWLCSVESDVVGVCREMRSSMKLADTCGDNDFVAAKSRLLHCLSL